ncbi:MAG: thiamine-phosphate kinase [Actinomycetota bacterium]
MARALSDVAAMAGMPVAAVVTLALPTGRDPAWAEAVYRGLCRTAVRWQVAVVGGETVSHPGHAWLSVALVGRVARGKAVMRSGARVGDALMVSGEGKHVATQFAHEGCHVGECCVTRGRRWAERPYCPVK